MRFAGPLAVAALGAMAFAVPESSAKPLPRPGITRDWTHEYAATTEGGFRVGNPKAKIAIVEYGSLTCPHCRHFAETAMKPLLSDYVRTGRASYEFRPFLLNGLDLAATLVARCDGPAHFFPVAEQLYATQPEWMGKLEHLSKEEQDKLGALPNDQLLLEMARRAGLLSIGAAHGIPAAKAQVCLKDQTAADALAKIEQAGIALGVQGTPSIFVNGKKVAAYDWDSLQPFLKEAGG